MGLLNVLLKAAILLLDLRDTYDALDSAKLTEIGNEQRIVAVRNAQDGSRQPTTRRRVGTSKRKAAVRSALTTILVWNIFQKVEPACDRTIAWFIPFYDSFKTLFLIWMLFTRSYGASILVYRFLSPLIRPYEHIIDASISLTLALFSWIASPLAPAIQSGISLFHGLVSAAPPAAERSMGAAPLDLPVQTQPGSPRSASGSIDTKSNKKSPPPHPSHAVPKPSVLSAAQGKASPQANQRLQFGPAEARQAPKKKGSQHDLAARRRILQELPVPSHPFEPRSSVPKVSTQAPASGVPTTAQASQAATVKQEPQEALLGLGDASRDAPSCAVPALQTASAGPNIGAPPTPPSGLHNYAFIPGVTPQRSGTSAVISPTPRFPGGFAVSFGALQASAASGSNPLQLQPRLPATSHMAPLSLTSPAPRPLRPVARNGVGMTHEDVISAHDSRIVPPPGGTMTIRKTPSTRSLKGGPELDAAPRVAKSREATKGKKRNLAEVLEGGEGDEPTVSKAPKTSPRKRSKPATTTGSATRKAPATTGSATAKKRAITTSTGSKGNTVNQRASAKDVAGRRAAASKGIDKTATAKTSPEAGQTGARVNSKSTGSLRNEAESVPAESASSSTKPAAKRIVKKAAGAGKPVADAPAPAVQAEEPPAARLTRSRTRQNLAE